MRCKTRYGKQKKSFKTEEEANNFLFVRSITYAGFNNEQYPYCCKRCNGWHLTSKTVEQYQETVMKFQNKYR
jgi:hypothetical protein